MEKKTDPYQPLFDHMHQEHGLTLLDSEMADIIHLVEKMQPLAQQGAAWVKGHYDRLYDQVKSGKRTVCYVDYSWKFNEKEIICRDICTIKPDNPGMELSARGISYGGIYKEKGETEKESFINNCEMNNVEWLDESGMPSCNLNLLQQINLSDIDAPAFTHTTQFREHFDYIKRKFIEIIRTESTPAKESDAVLEFIRDVAENWGCDEDGHEYNIGCRKCNAAELLYDLTRKQKEGNP